jgi:hypothetical protein
MRFERIDKSSLTAMAAIGRKQPLKMADFEPSERLLWRKADITLRIS